MRRLHMSQSHDIRDCIVGRRGPRTAPMSALQMSTLPHSCSRAEAVAPQRAAVKPNKLTRSFITPVLTTVVCIAAMLLLIVPLLTLEADARGGGGGGGAGAAGALAAGISGEGAADAVAAWAGLVRSAGRILAEQALGLAPSVWRTSAARGLVRPILVRRILAGHELVARGLQLVRLGLAVSLGVR